MRIKSLVLSAALFFFALFALASQEIGSSNYIYSPFATSIAAPPAYVHKLSLSGADFKRGDLFENMVDSFASSRFIYVLCGDKLIKLAHDFSLHEVITGYTEKDGSLVPLNGCMGIFVGSDDDYYIAQAEYSRILHFNADNSLRRILGRPNIVGFENVNYRPMKLVVDYTGRIYVIAKGMYEGIIELNPDGNFSRFYGVNKVYFTPADILWRNLATGEQRKRQKLWLPSDFTNLCIDGDGFIFATIQDMMQSIKRLNAKGENILRVPKFRFYPQGDLNTNDFGYGIPTGYSQLIAVDANEAGVYIALDTVRSRVFAYSEDHRMLYVFGGRGVRKGYFSNPIDLCFVGNDIMVLDALAQSIEVFQPTLYGQAMHKALLFQRDYRYEEAMEAWQETLKYNHNFDLAYAGMGRCLLREKKYDEALAYLRLGNDRKYYSKAFEKVRNQKLRDFFPIVLWVIMALIVLRLAVYAASKTGLAARLSRNERLARAYSLASEKTRPLKRFAEVFWVFPWRIMGSPFKGFDEMKYEKKGSYAFAFFILCFSALQNIMEFVYRGFLDNFNNPYYMDSVFLALITFFPVILFVASNWCVTTLLDGKGRFGEIFLTTMYALFPLVLLRLIALALTNILTLDEMPICYTLLSIASVLFVLYLFVGLAVIHEYSFSKCLASLLLTLVAMAIITFILMLTLSLTADVFEFFATVSKELMLKYF